LHWTLTRGQISIRAAVKNPRAQPNRARFNSTESDMDADPETAIPEPRETKKVEKGITGMWIPGQCELASGVNSAIRPAPQSDCFATLPIGLMSRSQLDEVADKSQLYRLIESYCFSDLVLCS
jgi:hypothetical protein